jgi:hypothetical protein
MLAALTALKKNPPGAERLAEILAVYAEAGVRDTHLVHICSNLEIPENLAGNVAVSLAKLSLPTCARNLALFSSQARDIERMYAAAIFKLNGAPQVDFDSINPEENSQRANLIRAAIGDFTGILNFNGNLKMEKSEERVLECVKSWTGVKFAISKNRLAIHLESLAAWINLQSTSPESATQLHQFDSENFVLIEILANDRDWYHHSENLKSKSMQEGKNLIKAERAAELAALKAAGWKVVILDDKKFPEDENLSEYILTQFATL